MLEVPSSLSLPPVTLTDENLKLFELFPSLKTKEDYDRMYQAIRQYCDEGADAQVTEADSSDEAAKKRQSAQYQKAWKIIEANMAQWEGAILGADKSSIQRVPFEQAFTESPAGGAPKFFEKEEQGVNLPRQLKGKKAWEDREMGYSDVSTRMRVFPAGYRDHHTIAFAADTHGDGPSTEDVLIAVGILQDEQNPPSQSARKSHVVFGGDIVDRGNAGPCPLIALLETWSRPENVDCMTVVGGDHEDISAKNVLDSFMSTDGDDSLKKRLSSLLPTAALFRGEKGGGHILCTHGLPGSDMKNVLVLRLPFLWGSTHDRSIGLPATTHDKCLVAAQALGISQIFTGHEHMNYLASSQKAQGVTLYGAMATGRESADSAYSGRQATVITAPPGSQGELVLLSDLPRRMQEIQQPAVQPSMGMIPEEQSSLAVSGIIADTSPQVLEKERWLAQLSVLFREYLFQLWMSLGSPPPGRNPDHDCHILEGAIVTAFTKKEYLAYLGVTKQDVVEAFERSGLQSLFAEPEEKNIAIQKKTELIEKCNQWLQLPLDQRFPAVGSVAPRADSEVKFPLLRAQPKKKKQGLFQTMKKWIHRHPIWAGVGCFVCITIITAAAIGIMIVGAPLLPVAIPLVLGAVAAGVGLVNAGVAGVGAAAGAVIGAAPAAAETVRSVATTAGVTAVNTAKILGQAALTKTSSAVTTAAQVAGETAGQAVTVIESHPVATGLIATGASITGASVAGATATAATISAGKAIHDFVVQKKGTDAEGRGDAERPAMLV